MQNLQDFIETQNFKKASIFSRLMAHIVDEFIISFLFIAIFSDEILSIESHYDSINFITAHLAYYTALKIIYQSFFVWAYGASMGKIFFKIKIIYIATQDNPSFAISVIRACVRIISENILFLGFLWGIMDKNHQTWHDKIANTLVVNV